MFNYTNHFCIFTVSISNVKMSLQYYKLITQFFFINKRALLSNMKCKLVLLSAYMSVVIYNKNTCLDSIVCVWTNIARIINMKAKSVYSKTQLYKKCFYFRVWRQSSKMRTNFSDKFLWIFKVHFATDFTNYFFAIFQLRILKVAKKFY